MKIQKLQTRLLICVALFSVASALACAQRGSPATGNVPALKQAPASSAAPQKGFTTRGTESHGGSIVLCHGKTHSAVALDYYHATLPIFGNPKSGGDENIIEIAHLSEVQTVNLFISRLGNRYFATQLKEVIRLLNYSPSWTAADLKDLDDSNEPYVLPGGCTRKTAVIRQGDHEMFIDPSAAALLSPSQLGIMTLHEAVYYIAVLHGLKTSDRVRALMREVLRKDSYLDDGHLDQLISDVGGNTEPGSMYDFLSAGWYTETSGIKYADGKPLSIYFTRKGPKILNLHIERKDIFQAGATGPIEHSRDKVGELRCSGVPFRCLGKDEKFQKMLLSVPEDDARFILLKWFYDGRWTEMRFTKPGEN